MKTNKNIKTNKTSELQSRPEHLFKTTAAKPASPGNVVSSGNAQAVADKPERPPVTAIDLKQRDLNRALCTDDVLSSLTAELFALAEVVGKWVWITFPEPPAPQVRAELSQLGFHWNNHRKCWQHPCGTINSQLSTLNSPVDPRAKYGARPASQPLTPAPDLKAA